MITVEKIVRAFEKFETTEEVKNIYFNGDDSKTEIQLAINGYVTGSVIFDDLTNRLFVTKTTIEEIK